MDWFAWLSKTGLDRGLVYDYGLEFMRNELEAEDLPHFDHEFLQSMGISIAKHRLEILKLARKDASRPPRRFSSLVSVISRTKRSVGKYIGKLVSHEEVGVRDSHMPVEGAREDWRVVALTRKYNSHKEDLKDKKLAYKHRSLALSGPLDGNFQEKYLTDAHRSPKFSGPKSPNFSGPLDAKSYEKPILALRSPKFSGPLDMWAANRSPKVTVPVDGRPVTARSPKFSGPLERATNRSPRVSGPLEGMGPGPRSSPRVHGHGNLDKERMVDGFDEHSLWAKLFHDMKPT